MNITVNNFQAIREATLELKPGLVVIVGPNNSGKTALFRAISAAVFNRGIPDDMIRRGQGVARVFMEHDGHDIVWSRHRNPKQGSSKTVYEVDGEDFTKLAGATLPAYNQFMGLAEVKFLEKQKITLNFWNQEAAPFLMNATAGQLFEFLSTSTEEGNLTQVVKDIKADLDTVKAEVTRGEGSYDTVSNELTAAEVRKEALSTAPDFFSRVQVLVSQVQHTNTLSNLTMTLAKLRQIIDKESVLNTRLQQTVISLGEKLLEVERTLTRHRELQRNTQVLGEASASVTTLTVLHERLTHHASALSTATSLWQAACRKDVEVSTLRHSSIKLAGVIVDVERISREVTVMAQFRVAFDKVSTDSNKLMEIAAPLSRLSQVVENRKAEQSRINELEKRREGIVHQLQVEFMACPLCGRQLSSVGERVTVVPSK